MQSFPPETKIVFTYFNGKGLGESVRYLLSYGGQKFVDNRFTVEQWPQIKPTTPFGQTPMLEINGKKYAQSLAIARFLGHKFGLAGVTLEEDLEIDMTADFINDIRAKAAAVHYEKNEAAKKEKHEDLSQNVYPVMLGKLDEIIGKNKGHLALGKLTWADFVFAGIFDYLKIILQTPNLEEKYPNFKKVIDNVVSLPQLQDYLTNKPKTDL